MPNRIAVCFSGQPRTWRKAIETWSFLHDGVDVFCHIWNFNTISARIGNHEAEMLTDKELNDLIDALQPVAYLIESRKPMEVINHSQALRSDAHLSQLYGIMMSGALKRQHEIENNFIYDTVIRCRYDISIPVDVQDALPSIRKGIFHGVGLRIENNSHTMLISDYFWASDSTTYDLVSSIWLDLPEIEPHWFAEIKDISPEHILYHHLKKNSIEAVDMGWDIRILRRSEGEASNSTDLW